jgi:multidrug efflux pump subunit AcrA (membrane-fusion protein)
VLAYGSRRFFRSTPSDPPPKVTDVVGEPSERLALPPPDQLKVEAGAARLEADPSAHIDYLADVAPLSGIRVGKARTVADLNEITGVLDKWDAPPPAFVKPRTDAATYTPDTANPQVDVSAALNNNRLYQAARAADEPAFMRYEKLLERKETFRRWIEELGQGRAKDVDTTLEAIDKRIAALEARRRSVQGIKNKTNIKAEIAEARADKAKLLEAAKTKRHQTLQRCAKNSPKLTNRCATLRRLSGVRTQKRVANGHLTRRLWTKFGTRTKRGGRKSTHL